VIFTSIYIVLSFIILFQGIFQIAGRNRRSVLSWYFFALCAAVSISSFNTGIQFYIAFLEGVGKNESSYILSKINMIFSSIQIMFVPFFFAFTLNLSKIKSKGIRILQRVVLSANTLALSAIFIMVIAVDALDILSSDLFNLSMLSIVIFSLSCLVFFLF
jgi:hypothetical protein